MKGSVKQLALVVGALAALAPALASAQESESKFFSKYGGYFLVGGGVTNYVNSAVKDQTDVGGVWDLRVGLGNRYYVGGEVAYVGSARSAAAIGSSLYTNGIEGVLRVQYPWSQGSWLIEPFAFGGIGYTNYDLTSATGVAMQGSDDVTTVPFGGGVTFEHNRLLLDARFTYRETFKESLIRDTDGGAASLASWAVTASVGYAF